MTFLSIACTFTIVVVMDIFKNFVLAQETIFSKVYPRENVDSILLFFSNVNLFYIVKFTGQFF